MNELEQALANVPNEGEKDPFKELGKETPSESPPEIKPESEQPKEGAHTPEDQYKGFHEHPRWIQREKELEELKAREAENTKIIAELNEFREQASKRFESDDPAPPVPDWFKELYGDNDIAWKKYDQYEKEKESRLEQKFIERQEKVKQEEQSNIAKWNNWVEGEIVKLQGEGLKFDRNELIKTMLDYRPSDENNNLDFHKGYKIYEMLRGKEDPAHSLARKQLADTTTKVSGEQKTKDYMTAADLRHRSWGNL